MNKGYLRQRGKTSWQIRIYLTGGDGRKQPHFETFRGQKRDAQRRLNELLVEADKGTIVRTSGKLTVGQYLNDWLNGYVKTTCGLRQSEDLESIIKNHYVPAFGNIPLQKLTPQQIQSYYSKKMETLSARTIHKHHQILKQSFRYAIKQGYLSINPCDRVDAPRYTKKVMRFLTPDEIEVVFNFAENNYYFPVIFFAVNTGMRQAEILGLRWRDIDLDMLSISVNQVLLKRKGIIAFKEPKTAHSRRHISMTPKLAGFLRDYKADRESTYIQLGRVLSLDDLVFTSELFTPADPSVVSHNYKRIVDKAGLSGVRFHDLRHTFASIMLLRGVSPKVVSEALGHASVAFTMDTYSHIIKGMQEDAMKLLDEILPSAKYSAKYSAKTHYSNSNGDNLAPKLDNKEKFP